MFHVAMRFHLIIDASGSSAALPLYGLRAGRLHFLSFLQGCKSEPRGQTFSGGMAVAELAVILDLSKFTSTRQIDILALETVCTCCNLEVSI